MSTITEREAAARSTVIDRLKNDNALKERAIVELEDWNNALLRQRAAVLIAAKEAKRLNAMDHRLDARKMLDKIIALAEGDQDGAA